jgi:hypothetical protein
MPARIRHFVHTSQTTGTTALTTSYGTARTHNLTQGLAPFITAGTSWTAFLESLNITVDTIAAGATSLTLRVTSDVGGDECIIPDTTATISTGISTATDGTVAFSSGIAFTNINTANQADAIVYVWVKTNAGTCNLAYSTIVWSE